MKKLFLLSLSFFFCFSVDAQLITMNTEKSKSINEASEVFPNTAGESKTKSYLWEFLSVVPNDFDDPKYRDIDVGFFGREIACLDHIFETSYVTREKMVPGDPTERTIIKKQSVYNITRNIEKFYKKELKKGQVDRQQVVEDYSHVLKVAIALVDTEDTTGFETELGNQKKDPQLQIEVFKKVKLNNIYSK